MPHITVNISPKADALLQALATKERRSKREQLAHSAITHAKSILPDFKYEPKKKGVVKP